MLNVYDFSLAELNLAYLQPPIQINNKEQELMKVVAVGKKSHLQVPQYNL